MIPRGKDGRRDLGGGRLAALVQERIDQGETTRKISQRAWAAGHKLSHAQVAYFRRGETVKMPDDDMREALAAGLQVPLEVIRDHVAHDWLDIEAQR